MSSPAQGGPSAPKEKKGVSSRVLTRMKTMIKKAEKRISLSGPSKPGPSSPAAAEPPAGGAPVTAAVIPAAATVPAKKKAEAAGLEPTKVSRMKLHEERARKLGERFGLEIQLSEWHSTEGEALRVNKPIRMRVHRVCHECNTEFGSSKECTNCKHARCKKCPRYPPKRTEAEKVASRERRAQIVKERKENAPIVPDWDHTRKPITLTIPSKNGGRDLVYKKPRQRVRRNCCQCNKMFLAGNKKCPGCEHARCTDCPRDPAKKNKYPYGYPGDEFGAKSIPRYRCQVCKTKFPAETDNGSECAKCSHPKCADCPRLLPQRVEPEPDPEILRSIEIRMAKMKVG
ncbi:hypothetical protein CMQ_3030 [Grosmannia clavigera kw1407]|uniref:Zinc finger protein n=1 Tax=Grosmannia clavigera (strain kw1407 / UAMH 11150) TaxID=655863 RepID=F0XGP6_GROCL|nr:uncharacterized protein CMQ_3030 [Grosmannia clavigera kw1407]EFX03101.1 hypothetical protein CMQ_3030 [Grosmannia clavigera kw1407]